MKIRASFPSFCCWFPMKASDRKKVGLTEEVRRVPRIIPLLRCLTMNPPPHFFSREGEFASEEIYCVCLSSRSHGKLVGLQKPFLPPPTVPSRGEFRLAAVKQIFPSRCLRRFVGEECFNGRFSDVTPSFSFTTPQSWSVG